MFGFRCLLICHHPSICSLTSSHPPNLHTASIPSCAFLIWDKSHVTLHLNGRLCALMCFFRSFPSKKPSHIPRKRTVCLSVYIFNMSIKGHLNEKSSPQCVFLMWTQFIICIHTMLLFSFSVTTGGSSRVWFGKRTELSSLWILTVHYAAKNLTPAPPDFVCYQSYPRVFVYFDNSFCSKNQETDYL